MQIDCELWIQIDNYQNKLISEDELKKMLYHTSLYECTKLLFETSSNASENLKRLELRLKSKTLLGI